MPIEDLRHRPAAGRFVADVCIVGSGPAGATIALELAATGVAICLVESGGAEPDPAVDDLSEIESVGMHRAPQAVTRARVLGGTSSLWTGRCGALDAVDFAERPWVPHSGWPITDDDLAPYLDRAGALLGLGPARYRGHRIDRVDPPSAATGAWDRSSLLPVLFQFSVGDPANSTAVREAPAAGVEGAEHIGALQHVGAPAAVDFGAVHLPTLADRPATVSTEPRPAAARLRAGLIGFGDRTRRFHLPVLQALADRFEVVGFTARSEATRRRAAGDTGLADYPSAADLVAAATPDLVVAAVSPDAVDTALPGILGLGVPVLLETPLCWNLAAGRSALAQIESSGLLVGVAEQTPHLPLEQLKRRLIELGLIGQVESAQNDGAVFDYHGLAALRAYLDGGRRPALVRATKVPGQRGPVLQATITCTDGTTLLHRYEDGVEGSLLATTSAGGLRDGTVIVAQPGSRQEIAVERLETEVGDLRALVARLPQADVRWDNPFAGLGFTDEQVAVASVLVDFDGAVRTGGEPAYLPEDSLLDMELLTAMRYSAAEGGREITLPVSTVDRVRSKLAPRLRRR